MPVTVLTNELSGSWRRARLVLALGAVGHAADVLAAFVLVRGARNVLAVVARMSGLGGSRLGGGWPGAGGMPRGQAQSHDADVGGHQQGDHRVKGEQRHPEAGHQTTGITPLAYGRVSGVIPVV